MVFSHVIRGCVGGLYQVSGGEAVMITLASVSSSIRAMCPNMETCRNWTGRWYCFIQHTVHTQPFYLLLLLFWHAPLGVRSAIHRHQPPQKVVLNQIGCFIQRKVVGSHVSLNGVQACDTRMPWSLPGLWRGAVTAIIYLNLCQLAHPGGPGKRAVKRLCVCVCVS